MRTIQLLLITGLVFVAAGYLIGCSDNEPNQGSSLLQSNDLKLELISAGLNAPVFITASPRDPTRLLIVEQGGLIRIFNLTTGSLLGEPFLNISNRLSIGGERGLLGMALDPGYISNGQFYVFYTDGSGNLVIARYQRVNLDLANPASEFILLTITRDPTFSNHNGGMLAFGPDGCLYAGVGDGGSSGDPNNNGQNTNTRLGKILRINPALGGPCAGNPPNPFLVGGAPEVWSLGLRNPWRFSFDSQAGDLYIGDVGQDAREEINVSLAPNAGRALNYGWRLMEGFLCFNPSNNCNPGNLTLPVLDYEHSNDACSGSVTGGYVYRGTAKPERQGTYFYADFCAGFVRSFRHQNGQATEQTEWPLLSPPGGSITSFGEDASGELYLMTQGGSLFKLVPN
ncbi:MAG TPA: PQQ-dependent sugar dehydrogenase [Nitrospiraceae bacterium]|nr:PQQ-dependent sugar dehydrogenase [Nitrospiraceae bacterium]